MLRPPILDPLFAPVDALKGVGPSIAKLLAKLLPEEIPGQQPRMIDLLLHLPSGAIDRRARVSVAESRVGEVATLTVRVEEHRPPPPGRARAPYRILVSDDTSDLVLTYFGGETSYLQRLYPVGAWRVISGTVEIFDGVKQMSHPDHALDPEAAGEMPAVEPVYPSTDGLSQKTIRKSVLAALPRLPTLPEWIDGTQRAKSAWPTFQEALTRVHTLEDPSAISPMGVNVSRLAYDELMAGQLAMGILRSRTKTASGRVYAGDGRLIAAVKAALPFSLTGSQAQAVEEILADMGKPERMLRLLQGDVGSGKTVVALIAMARAAEAGAQSALMAPTEILARQHFKTIEPLAAKAGLKAAILTGREKGRERAAILAELAAGRIAILVGTHALFQDGVVFHDLGLAVIDEQHRFGVHQRLALTAKGRAVDLLATTATPIPRSLVLTFYGDMDASRLTEKPPGRQPIDTRLLPLDRLDEVEAAVGRAIDTGARVYWICPLVEENALIDQAAAEARHQTLSRRYGRRVGLLHGRLSGPDKDAALASFARGDTQILVATTVVEVGVDVPEATIIVIEQAERFGLAQLHQLRGRVGRGSGASTCLLLYDPRLSETGSKRLKVIKDTEDGFVIAEADLELRGPGEVLGTKQSGIPDTRVVSWEVHRGLIGPARDDARRLLEMDPDLTSPRGLAARLLLNLFGKTAALRLVDAG